MRPLRFTWFTRATLCLLIGATVCGSQTTTAQTKEEIRSQAESRLSQMTPDEIDAKLRELGISRDEAVRRAADFGISLQDFLRSSENQAVPTAYRKDTTVTSSVVLTSPPKTLAQQKKVFVPGFSDRSGIDTSLQPFGYEVFGYPSSTFEPVLNVATPPTYPLGPGDEIVIAVWGETRLNYSLRVNREGNVIVPDVGPVGANGLTIQQFRERLLRRMTAIYSGLRGGSARANTFLDVSLASLRTIQIFVLGEVQRPGGYSVSSMSTVFQALYLTGGPTVDGSLRNIEIIRGGTVSGEADLYEYIASGVKTGDLRLQDGDVVFVRPAARRVAIQGKVIRPAMYEMRDGEALGDLLRLAGGLRFDAFHERVHVQRMLPFDQRIHKKQEILEIDVASRTVEDLRASRFPLEAGDIVSIAGIKLYPENRLTLTGNVRKPGVYELVPGMRVRDLVLRADSLDRNTFMERASLFRMLPSFRRKVLSFNLGAAMQRDEKENLALQNEDSVVIFAEDRFFPERTVSISGAIRFPGTYRRNENMTLSDLIVLAGGIREEGSLLGIEVSRVESTSVEKYSTVFKVNLTDNYWDGKDAGSFLLADLDHVQVSYNPKFSAQKFVDVTGYVMFPGKYAILGPRDRVTDLIARAGGLRPGAYLEASRLIRKDPKTGAIPLDFREALAEPTSRDNIALNEGDSIHVAFLEDVVYVRGEVLIPTAVLYKKGASMDYYIDNAGGYTNQADEGRTVVFLPTGKKWEPGWFFIPNPDILPGSTIIAPKKLEKPDNTLPILRDMATILASLAAITVGIIQVTK